jgi:hypothetical protein
MGLDGPCRNPHLSEMSDRSLVQAFKAFGKLASVEVYEIRCRLNRSMQLRPEVSAAAVSVDATPPMRVSRFLCICNHSIPTGACQSRCISSALSAINPPRTRNTE